MKKCMLIALITVFALVSVGALCSADSLRRVTNTSKKGSLLVYPLIKVSPVGAVDGNDTIVLIGNDYPTKVRLNCRYMWPDNCGCKTFSFTLTGNQSIAFSAQTGKDLDGHETFPRKIDIDPFPGPLYGQYAGELRCWATTMSNSPISWNHLYGSAIVKEGENQTWEYSAWRFAVGYEVARGHLVEDDAGNPTDILRLTGMPNTYDACPERLLFNFVKQVADPTAQEYEAGLAENRLTLVPCKQDCVSSPVQARFSIYDEYENDASANACWDCDENGSSVWTNPSGIYSKSLSDATKFNLVQDFGEYHGTPGGMALVSNTPNGQCVEVTYGIPLLGVISTRFSGATGPVAGESLTTVGRAQPYLTINGEWTVPPIEVHMDTNAGR